MSSRISSNRKKAGRKSKQPPLPAGALGARIKAARQRAGLSLIELGRRVGGISNPSLSNIETGVTKQPHRHTLMGLGRELKDDFGLQWLRELLREEGLTAGRQIRLFGRVAAGKPLEPILEEDFITIPARMVHRTKSTFALQVVGDSMTGVGILDGDIIICHECTEPAPRQVIVAQVNDELTLKIWHRRGDKAILRPAYPAFDNIEIKAGVDEVRCLGEYAGLIRFAR
jgi:SOS-response transcriptional repressor LexA